MPKFIVKEKRARQAEYLIEAADEESAGRLDGDIIDEGGDADDYGLELVSVELVGDDVDCIPNA